jgi:hypothetical protein
MTINSVLRTDRLIITFLSAITFIFFSYTAAFAGPNGGMESKVSLTVAWERLQYKEHEPDKGLDAQSDLNNMVVGIEGVKRWEHLFLGAGATFPISRESGKEEATLSGNAFQENALELGWVRIDGFLGYPLRDWINPYMGFRWSEVRQERKNFVVAGAPVTSQSIEEVKSLSLLFGICGAGIISPRWIWNYRAELFLPLSVNVTNTALPGFESSDKSGHMAELKGEIDYLLGNSIYSGLLLYGGWMHWNGSQWQSFDWGRAKWPENDTYYLGVGLNIVYEF